MIHSSCSPPCRSPGLSQRYFDLDGTWVKYWEHPNFVALLTFANTLYTEGLLDPTRVHRRQEAP